MTFHAIKQQLDRLPSSCTPQSDGESIPLLQSPMNQKTPLPRKSKVKQKEVTLYKTELCRNWMELGQCRYGNKCRYAHGKNEVRTVQRHARYKTQICRAYHSEGSCPYGTRCTFIHESMTISNTMDFMKHSVLRRDSLTSHDGSLWSETSDEASIHSPVWTYKPYSPFQSLFSSKNSLWI